ncbi:MAG: hypothetical protein JWQ81_2134 [Amycolatopsis sp.]|uniref:hypothetical protein n=1 Tax=Amycolatopsis sp. TaxID=37632 RepID=UPI002624C6C0|nr:hypothetical protein [Amycolatopsis sp.]MCU1681395.1 hypothetical protein [Amycolatopsis sp.]
MTVDVRDFSKACFSAARATGRQVLEVVEATQPTPNFHLALLEHRDVTVAVLANREVPLLAIAPPPAAGQAGPLSFLDVVDLAAALSQIEPFKVLSVAELSRPLSQITSGELPPHDPYDIRYWQPATFGDVVFNYWD